MLPEKLWRTIATLELGSNIIDNIQQEVLSPIGNLVSEWDILTVKCEITGSLERIYDGLDLIKASRSFKAQEIRLLNNQLWFLWSLYVLWES